MNSSAHSFILPTMRFHPSLSHMPYVIRTSSSGSYELQDCGPFSGTKFNSNTYWNGWRGHWINLCNINCPWPTNELYVPLWHTSMFCQLKMIYIYILDICLCVAPGSLGCERVSSEPDRKRTHELRGWFVLDTDAWSWIPSSPNYSTSLLFCYMSSCFVTWVEKPYWHYTTHDGNTRGDIRLTYLSQTNRLTIFNTGFNVFINQSSII